MICLSYKDLVLVPPSLKVPAILRLPTLSNVALHSQPFRYLDPTILRNETLAITVILLLSKELPCLVEIKEAMISVKKVFMIYGAVFIF